MITDNILSRIIYDASIKNKVDINEATLAYEKMYASIKEHIVSGSQEEIKISYFGKFKFNEKYFNKLTEIRNGKSNNDK
jgi:nucleoid DNA-binding protein